MRVINLSLNGIEPVTATPTQARNGRWYYVVTHGEEGRGRWELRYPLGARDFPCDEGAKRLTLDEDRFGLRELDKKDARGNRRHIITGGPLDNKFLVFWYLSPGYRGGASYKIVHGDAEVLAVGEEAQGAAGRMGGAECPVVLVTGPCLLEWTRSGRLYNSPARWQAKYDGYKWLVGSYDELALEDEIFA